MREPPGEFELSEDEIAVLSEEYVAENARNRRLRALFLEVFGSEAGKEVLGAIRDEVCRVGVSCFDENPVLMARKAGRQEAFFAIDEILKAAAEEAAEEGRDD